MDLSLDGLYKTLNSAPPADGERLTYSVAALPMYPGSYVGRDSNEKACILIAVMDRDTRHQPPIRLESLEVQFDVQSLIKAVGEVTQGTFTVIRCRSHEPEFVRYFLSIGETILRVLGVKPTRGAIAHAINRLAIIFQRIQNPPIRSVGGLFGELFLIRRSSKPRNVLAAWRTGDSSRFDFSSGDIRLDVKTAAGRLRSHTFTYDQCNPPPGTVAIVASLFVERIASGISLHDLVRGIEMLAGEDTNLIMKLHETVAETLGKSIQEALTFRFDERLAASSVEFYDLRSIPAIRGEPPVGVSDIHFRSELSGLKPIDVDSFIEHRPAFSDFLPSPRHHS
jgi:hypothetical protein